MGILFLDFSSLSCRDLSRLDAPTAAESGILMVIKNGRGLNKTLDSGRDLKDKLTGRFDQEIDPTN